uniref:Uncharacterized protein n=1 Tax=viral metagenome TaxID=1070528 RepID=A0A6M3IG72_9ZZZZ
MILITNYILSDEKAMGLYEINEIIPNGEVWNRYQIIHVIRGDRIALYRKNLGLAKNFKALQIRIPSYMEHTVNELREMADQMRNEKDIDLRELVQLDKIKT